MTLRHGRETACGQLALEVSQAVDPGHVPSEHEAGARAPLVLHVGGHRRRILPTVVDTPEHRLDNACSLDRRSQIGDAGHKGRDGGSRRRPARGWGCAYRYATVRRRRPHAWRERAATGTERTITTSTTTGVVRNRARCTSATTRAIANHCVERRQRRRCSLQSASTRFARRRTSVAATVWGPYG